MKARNTNLPCIPATRIETKPWSLIGEESEAQLRARFTEYSNGKRMQCTVDIKSLQPWSVGVSGIPYMVGVAEELLRLATFTTEFDIKAVIADRAVYCFEVVCEHVQKELRGTENESILGSRSSDMINNPGQTFKRFPTYWGWVRNSLTKYSPSGRVVPH